MIKCRISKMSYEAWRSGCCFTAYKPLRQQGTQPLTVVSSAFDRTHGSRRPYSTFTHFSFYQFSKVKIYFFLLFFKFFITNKYNLVTIILPHLHQIIFQLLSFKILKMSSSNNPNNQKTLTTPRSSYNQPIYSSPVYHYCGILPYYPQQFPQLQKFPPQYELCTMILPTTIANTNTTTNDPEFNVFDFLSRLEFVQQTLTPISDTEPEFFRETQLT